MLLYGLELPLQHTCALTALFFRASGWGVGFSLSLLSAVLMNSLSMDGLEAAGEPELSSPGPRMQNQVSVRLTSHDWMMSS